MNAVKRTRSQRGKFRRSGALLVDRTAGRDVTVYPKTSTADATASAIRLIEARRYDDLAPLLSVGLLSRDVRSALVAAANTEKSLPPNLAQALALIAGAKQVAVLRRNFKPWVAADFEGTTEAEQATVLYGAYYLLQVRPSVPAARTLVACFQNGTNWIPIRRGKKDLRAVAH